jgi:cyclase
VLRPRIIPTLLVQGGGLVKTIRFDSPKYVGDPINAVRIFNEKQVDELIVADIDATIQGREPDYGLIRNLASECRMPLCYAGGVTQPEQIERIVALGVEKVAVGSAAVQNPALIESAARRVGRQSVVAVLDVRKSGLLRRYEVFTHGGRQATGLHPVEYARRVEALGAGEVLLNSIDMDGGMKGYDLDLITQVRNAQRLPMSVLGGAGSLADIEGLIERFGIIGAAAGSLFVFKGKYRAVLINYPGLDEKDSILGVAARRLPPGKGH